MKREPFITGSRAYGTPRDTSDIDLVIHVEDPDVRRTLEALNETPGKGIHFGRLNLIAVNAEQYDIWKTGTEALRRRAPVSREDAVKVFKSLRVKSYDSGADDQAEVSDV